MIPKLHHALLLALLVLTGASCRSKKTDLSDDPLVRPEDEQELAGITTYSKEVVQGWPRGRSLHPRDVSRVRLGEEVHAYHLGRLPSRDRREMHEAHTVYRVEQDARWDTRLPATPMDSGGVILGITDPARDSLPKDILIAQERERLATMALNLQKSMARLDELRRTLEKKSADFDAGKEEAVQIKQYLAEIRADRDEKEEQLKNAQERIKALEEQQRLYDMTSQQSGARKP
ncbi:MAG TPA: hypothetical protein DIT64_16910 [Verrucomicrobiales bacterium]|nr:hypothetical protein [Verrucomicrobiales bacterium]HCN75829.1 hypothetical protein [Verrucomicrobiales bacterium]HRJ10760.1 hypothetical protein [Prosthecobacter sp.]HRK16815.1 hypothetical protein [Prosthecobacter sp.]